LAPPPPPPRECELIHLKLVELKEQCRARSLAVSGACSQRPLTRSAPAWLTRARARARAGTKAVLIGRLLGQAPVLPKPKPRKAAAASVPLFEDDSHDDDDAQAEQDDDDDDDFEASPPARRCARSAHWLCALRRRSRPHACVFVRRSRASAPAQRPPARADSGSGSDDGSGSGSGSGSEGASPKRARAPDECTIC
jgi:hypothetical protein